MRARKWYGRPPNGGSRRGPKRSKVGLTKKEHGGLGVWDHREAGGSKKITCDPGTAKTARKKPALKGRK